MEDEGRKKKQGHVLLTAYQRIGIGLSEKPSTFERAKSHPLTD
jgi:hypothetical protein